MNDINYIDGLVGNTYSSVKVFNTIANNLGSQVKGTTKERLLNQIKIIQEELDEFKKAVETENNLETLDGIADVIVTSFGALQMVDEQCKAREGLLEVCANNLTKYVQVTDPNAKSIIDATIQMYKDKGEEVTVELNTSFGVYVFKDSNGKIRKPSNYKTVDLVSYL